MLSDKSRSTDFTSIWPVGEMCLDVTLYIILPAETFTAVGIQTDIFLVTTLWASDVGLHGINWDSRHTGSSIFDGAVVDDIFADVLVAFWG